MIGSACFALGSVPGYLDAVGATADGITFFVGSIFFTVAAFVQFLQSTIIVNHGRDWVWWAALVQLVGTGFFNVSTFHALSTTIGASQEDQLVWRPDAFGSVCFLVASGLSIFVVGWLTEHPSARTWSIAGINMAGSVAFGASAVASYVVPASGLPRNVELVNLGTFLGALCFLVGAYLLLPRPPTRSAGRPGPQSAPLPVPGEG